MLGWVCELQLAHLGELPDFNRAAFAQGRLALQDRPDKVLLAHLRPEADVVVTELITHVLAISAKVARDELALRN